jgi:DNA replication protein DnaC
MRSDDCGKCGRQLVRRFGEEQLLLQPWCWECSKKHRVEYGPVFAEWVNQKAGAVLRDMGVPVAYRACTFDSFEKTTKDQQRALRLAEGWAKDGDTSLFLCGPCGVGKTHLATAALLAMRAQGCSGRYVSSQELLAECKDSFRHNKGLEAVLEKYCTPNVLFLDDLGAENPTPFTRETIGLLIDRAYRDARDLIITSNYDFKELTERLDVRTVDRLIELCLAVKLTGSSYRQKLAAQRTNLRNLPTSEVLQ